MMKDLKTRAQVTKFIEQSAMQDLRSIRIAKGLKQHELAERAGISRVQVSNLETGKCNAQPETRKSIEVALGTSVDWLACVKLKLRDSGMNEAERLVKRLIELSVLMNPQERESIIITLNKYI